MSKRNNTIIVASTSKAIRKAKVTGKMDLHPIYSYALVDYLIDFIDETIANGSTLYKATKQDLLLLMADLRYRNTDDICNIKISSGGPSTTKLNDSSTNTAPTVSLSAISLSSNTTHTFTVAEFISNFTDAQNDLWNKLMIYPAGLAHGTLTYNGTLVTDVLVIDVEDVVKLVYTRTDSGIFTETVPFRISDNNVNSLYSTLTNNTITSIATTAGNQPATIGDSTIYVDNRVTTILSLAMFTSLLQPPYNDPEGDLIDAIRIDQVSTANTGQLLLSGVPVVEGVTIITRENLTANLFTHVGPDDNSLKTDSFTFSARDEGSLEWVQ